MDFSFEEMTRTEAQQTPAQAQRIKPSARTRAQSRVPVTAQTQAAESFGAGDIPSLAGPWTPTQTSHNETAQQREARKAAILAYHIWDGAYHSLSRFGSNVSWTQRGRVERLWQNAHRAALEWAATYRGQ